MSRRHKHKNRQQERAIPEESQNKSDENEDLGKRTDDEAFVAPDIRPEDDPRMQFMNQIAAQRYEEEKDDFVPTDGEKFMLDEKEVVSEESQEQEEEETVSLKIDGKEERVPLSKVLDVGKRALQKELSADEKLEKATRMLREAEEKLAAQPSPAPGDVAPKTSFDLDPEDQESIEKLSEKIRYGGEEEAQEAFAELVKMGRRGGSATPQQIRQAMEQINMENIQARFRNAEDQGGFADIYNEPILLQMAGRRVDQLVAEGARYDVWETYQRAGEEIRAMKDVFLGAMKHGKLQALQANDLAERREKKRNLDVVRGVSAKLTSKDSEDEETEPKTPSEIIREMAKRRVNPNVY